MFAHITQGSNNLTASTAFYDALLVPLGINRTDEKIDHVVCYQHSKEHSTTNELRFFVVTPFDDNRATAGNGAMVAFTAASRKQVDESYHNGIRNGGTDEGKPGSRPQYADGYYGAYLRDPDGNKIHVVYRGDLT